jgi:aspartyl protease family protein
MKLDPGPDSLASDATGTLKDALIDLGHQLYGMVMAEPLAQLAIIGIVLLIVGGWVRRGLPMAGECCACWAIWR